MRPAIFLLLVFLSTPACAAETDRDAGTGSVASTSTAPASPGEPSADAPSRSSDSIAVEVVRVLDGDSIETVVAGRTAEVRLLGINAPERDECWSDRALSSLEGLLTSSEVWLDPAGGSDRFGRVLGYLSTAERSVNLEMLAAGDAIAVDVDHPQRDAFLATEETAYAAGLGLWASEACGPSRGLEVAIDDLAYDAPGPDEQNLNGEWIALSNRDGAADLSGWTLRDESSSHRFQFPTGFILAAQGRVVVRTGCGADSPEELYWCADGSVWSNGGDTVLLLDDSGNVVDRLRYAGRP